MKGYLNSNEGIFRLSRKITTVGRENCSLLVRCSAVDVEHAVIEYEQREGRYYIRDLGSTCGTFINFSRISPHTATPLNNHDSLKFGGSSQIYEFNVEGHTKLNFDTEAKVSKPPSVNFTDSQGQSQARKPHCFGQVPPPDGFVFGQWSGGEGRLEPPHGSSRGPVRSQSSSRVSGEKLRHTISASSSSLCETLGNGYQSMRESSCKNNTKPSYAQLQMELKQLNEDVRRLSAQESAWRQRDEQASQLRQEVTVLQRRLRQSELNLDDLSQVQQQQKLSQIEREINSKKLDAHNLRQMISKMRPDRRTRTGLYHMACSDSHVTSQHVTTSRSSSPCRHCKGIDLTALKFEVEHLRKQLSGSSTTAAQIHQDMINKDSTIDHLTKEIEKLKTNIEQKSEMILSLESKIRRSEENKDLEEELNKREREIRELKNKQKISDEQLKTLTAGHEALRSDLERSRQTEKSNTSIIQRLQTELETACNKNKDMERVETTMKVSLQESLKKQERLRGAVIQSLFSSPGARAPNKLLSDEELIVALKSSSEEREELRKHVKVTEQSSEKSLSDNLRNVKQILSDSSDSNLRRK